MGISLSWIAYKNTTVEVAADQIGLTAVTHLKKVKKDRLFKAYETSDGWWIFVCREAVERFLPFELLSKDEELVWCSIDEHTGCSAVAHWKDGLKKWEVERHCDINWDTELKVTGELPPMLDEIRSRLLNEDAVEECDVAFGIAAEIAESVTGFRHDALPAHNIECFLRPVQGGRMDLALAEFKDGCRLLLLQTVVVFVAIVAALSLLVYWFSS